MADIFGRVEQTSGGAMSADSATLSFSTTAPGFILQQLGINYTQPVNRIYQMGTSKVYLIAGRPRGDGNISSVIGPDDLTDEFLSFYGNVCNAVGNVITINMAASCKTKADKQKVINMKSVVITNVNDNVRAEDMVLTEALQFMFLSMTKG